MIHAELESAINHQINQEFSAAYNYLGMAAYFDTQNLDGFAHWMNKQHDEEQAHGMRLLRYLQDRGGRVKLETIESPRSEFSGPLEAFQVSLRQEQKNTESINELYALATKLNDYATKSHLQWFIDEQVEEEKSVEDVIALLERIGDDSAGLLYLNDKLGERVAEDVPASELA
ncbi:MAG: ferritin [Verrucomicrobiales bacterium]